MRILYVAPEHVTGGFALFAKGHRLRGNECRWITFFPSRYRYPEDLCFNLRAMPSQAWVTWVRRLFNFAAGLPSLPDLPGNPPYWKPKSFIESALFAVRDWVNRPRICRTIAENGLDDYDVYHFEQGVDVYRDGRWVRSLAERGKGIVCFYHGSDLRNRGVIRAVHRWSALNLTSEIDLLERLPGMKYLFLPIDTTEIIPRPRPFDGRIRICHAARNRLKGTPVIEAAVRNLARKYPVEWVLIQNLPHQRALEVKSSCDIYIDQITDLGGWGYGASSVEALAMGLVTLTRINAKVKDFLGNHPFVPVTPDDLEAQLESLVCDHDRRVALAEAGRRWVVAHHDLQVVMDVLYGYYREAGLI